MLLHLKIISLLPPPHHLLMIDNWILEDKHEIIINLYWECMTSQLCELIQSLPMYLYIMRLTSCPQQLIWMEAITYPCVNSSIFISAFKNAEAEIVAIRAWWLLVSIYNSNGPWLAHVGKGGGRGGMLPLQNCTFQQLLGCTHGSTPLMVWHKKPFCREILNSYSHIYYETYRISCMRGWSPSWCQACLDSPVFLWPCLPLGVVSLTYMAAAILGVGVGTSIVTHRRYAPPSGPPFFQPNAEFYWPR